MLGLQMHGDPLLLPIAISLLACWIPGCQRVTETREAPIESSAANAVAKQTRIERWPDEPDDLPQDLPAEVMELLSEHFSDYTLPSDEPPPESESASKTITYSKQYVIQHISSRWKNDKQLLPCCNCCSRMVQMSMRKQTARPVRPSAAPFWRSISICPEIFVTR